ncbi:NrfD/PsrC family molybdoenzyme membrane anchor subunit [Microvirga roseola]|uniref:NrfD/PsrC family molybdoenzyme membrane anchor subunit n=1 Tax=Microvirga roseola TaxID=2883126 RepID=UPI001E2DDE73|nr:NrfD/PsrC family molybdoenzyme membrane anchor subunit [Microvirga roseola]
MAHETQASAAPIADVPLSPSFGWGWTIALLLSGILVVLLAYALIMLLLVGTGLWGTNIPFVWGFDLINYAWWIGIANGATLVASILVLRKHDLRTAVNRFAEAVSLFGVICAGIFPIFHLGKPWLFYWVFPLPYTFEVWPQFRSSLTWDFWAISTHAIMTAMLWYTGLIPDLATLRDRAATHRCRKVFGFFALGWRGSARHWAYHQTAYRIIAILMLPLILVMQSVVSLEHAVMLPPGWHQSSQPLYYIASGLAQGIAAVLLIAVLLRRLLGLERYIDDGDVQLMAKLVASSGLIIAYVYTSWILLSLLSSDAVRAATVARLNGTYAAFFWSSLVLMALVPQLLWIPRIRNSFWGTVLVALAAIVGVWLDRFSIMIGGLEKRYLPWGYDLYWPTTPEWFLLAGTAGLFTGQLLLFARYLPVVSMYETRHDEHLVEGR